MMEAKGLYRLLDANLNRACEGLRLLEDVARFVLDDAALTEKIRTARHELRDAAKELPSGLLATRDVPRDFGAAYMEAPHVKTSAFVTANARRVQEAARVLEETARYLAPAAAETFKRTRFLAYEIEKGLLQRFHLTEKVEILNKFRLYVIVGTSHTGSRPVLEVAREAIRGGAGIIQLREKQLPARGFLELALLLRKVASEAGVPLIINDRVDIAAASGADGVHLGQEDLPVSAARRILGEAAIIGVSTHSVAEAVAAEQDGADYIGVGPVFPPATKPGLEPKGLSLLTAVIEAVHLPVVAIGGIRPENLPSVLGTGVNRVAVVSAVAGAPDVAGNTALMLRILEGLN
ncbi:MAG TPA: thiamine phosphate synthase [Desulfotomaculum sp.]|nr:thiamine phosphate synthase [Desulfotomaculum sp.]